MASKSMFFAAASRLLGAGQFAALKASGFTIHDYCREIAQESFVSALQIYPGSETDIELIKSVAARLWKGDGVTGLDAE